MAHTGLSAMVSCPECGKELRARGLNGHLRWAHLIKPVAAPVPALAPAPAVPPGVAKAYVEASRSAPSGGWVVGGVVAGLLYFISQYSFKWEDSGSGYVITGVTRRGGE